MGRGAAKKAQASIDEPLSPAATKGPVQGIPVTQPPPVAPEAHRPYIPSSVTLPELTLKVFVIGIVLAMIMSSANAYLGMFASLTVSAAIPASVISMAVLRFFKKRNILENNLIQTTASAGESVTAGIIFTLPALLFLGYWKDIGIVETMIITALGGSLGVLFTIPLRRAFIVDAKLQYPEGVATVEVLKSGEKGGTGIGYILTAGLAAATFKFMGAGMVLWHETAEWTRRFGSTAFHIAGTLSPALIGVGFIIGLPIAILIFMGGVLGYVVGVPTWLALHPWPQNCIAPFTDFGCSTNVPVGEELGATAAFGAVRNVFVRYIGVGGMAAGGIYTLFKLRGALVRGFKSGLEAYEAMKSGKQQVVRTEHDMNMRTVLLTLVAFTIPLTVLFTYFVTDHFRDWSASWIGVVLAIVMLFAGFLFSAVAGYMAGVVGSSNNPISGTAIGTLIFTALLLLGLGVPEEIGAAATVLIAGTIAAAAAIAGDNMQDLKAGYLLGGTPKNLQIMQMVGAIAAAVSLPFVLMLLHKAYVIGSAKLPAAQANLMYAIAGGLFGAGIPWDAFWIGVLVAALIIAFDKYQEHRGASFRTPVLAVAIGIYLPFDLSVPIFVGGLVAHIARRSIVKSVRTAHPEAQPPQVAAFTERRINRGVLFASGVIAGESLVGILIAALIVIGQGVSPIALFESNDQFWPGLLILGYLVLLIWYSVTRGHPRREPLPVEA